MGVVTQQWAKAAMIRAVRTAAQTALSMLTVGQAFSSIHWGSILSVSAVAGIGSVLTSLAGLPEVKGGTDADITDGN